jgi:D-3-phosphoglycerate dehydrogenase / 2-oxoglutarate reductase
MAEKFKIKTLNSISANGLERLPWERFSVSTDVDDPDALLVRSADLTAA